MPIYLTLPLSNWYCVFEFWQLIIYFIVTWSCSLSDETVCPCDCIYYEKMEAFKNKTREKKSIEEIKEDLGPQLREMEKNLTVDTSTLSAYVSKKVSKDDKRQSSKQIGVVGIIFLTLELLTLILADLLSFRQHWTFIKECWCGFFKAVWDKVRRWYVLAQVSYYYSKILSTNCLLYV